MATYYVRKTGLDSNDGLSAGNAFLTIDKAANTVAAGDTVWVGAGTYREQVIMDTAGSSGSVIRFEADIDGEQTGDAGLVVISAYTDSDTATRASCWDPDGRIFVEVVGFVMQGGTLSCVYSSNATNDNFEGVLFEDCVFVAGPVSTDSCAHLNMNAGTTPTGAGLTFRRCGFVNHGIRIQWDGNETADQNLKIVVENCVFVGAGTNVTSAAAFWFDLITAGTFASGGVDFNNNTVVGYYSGVFVEHGTSTTFPVDARNNVMVCAIPLNKQTSNDGALTSNYNTFTDGLSNVTAGGNDRTETSTWLLGGLADLPLYRKFGWSPYLPFEPMRNPSDDDWTSLIGDANTADAPATDLYGNPRPLHGTVDDRGAVEGRARPEQETTTTRTGSNAIRFDGAGYHDFLVPVAAQSTTITVYGRYDSNYTGSLPKMDVLNIPGVADKTDTMAGAANAWEQLTSGAFTPTSAGVCRVRVSSQDTSATGQSFFDDLVVT